MSYIQGFAANGQGGIVYYGVVEALGTLVIVQRPADGMPRQVYTNSDTTDAGNYLVRYTGINICDSGRILIFGFYLNDNSVVYTADPI